MIRNVRTIVPLFTCALGCASTIAGCGTESLDREGTEVHRSAALSTSSLLATATLARPTDDSGLTDRLENGMPQNVLGGIGSGLAWAGGSTFLGVPDRGPNATVYANGGLDDNTTSFISRLELLDLALAPSTAAGLPFVLTPTLQGTTLFYSEQPLVYGSTAGLPTAVPAANTAAKFYFSGRSDNFGAGVSTNPAFARLDPEAIRVSRDGNSVFVADEYGPYIYQFDRATGRRIRVYQLPDHFAISNLNAVGATEIASNTTGRVTNKGVEGLAITPSGATLVALVQSPLLQDGGDGARPNRIVTIAIATGETHEYVYDNQIGTKAFNSSEIVALNDYQFLIDTRDGKGLGDGSTAVVKQLWAVNIAGAQDVSGLSGQATLLAAAVPKKLFVDMVPVLNANGFASTQIPAKIESLAFGPDVTRNGTLTHTLYVGNDNDFVPDVAGPNRWFVFGFSDADLAALGLSYTPQELTARGPDLALVKTAASDTAVTGTVVDYTLTVQNTGLVPASAVTVTDLLPAGLSFVSCSSSGTCGTSASGPSVGFSSLAGTATATATITARLSCALADGAVLVNQAAAASAGTDPTPANNSAQTSITARNPPATIAGLAVDPAVLAPPNGKLNAVRISYSVADNCAGTTCSLSVRSNQGTPADWMVVDAHTVNLRAKRTNDATRIYTVTVTCVDSGGAISTADATVSVLHD